MEIEFLLHDKFRDRVFHLLDYIYVTADLTDAITHFTDPGNYRSHRWR